MTFSADITAATTRDGMAAFQREWSERIAEPWPLPDYGIGGPSDFRIAIRAVQAHDVLIMDLANHGRSFTARTPGLRGGGNRVLVNLLRRGAYHFDQPDGPSTASPGSFLAHDNGVPTVVRSDPSTVAKVLVLPVPALIPLTDGRPVAGSDRSTEVRVLTAHASILSETAGGLSPAGVLAARDALLELVRGALLREFDDAEPRLAPGLARAAMKIADNHLEDPDLSPLSLARELHVSVRTLHRAFAAAGEPVAAYIRRRRLEEARLDLTAPLRRPTVSEVAARWRFADQSHFIRAFTKKYGETPAQFARSGSPA